MYLLGPIWSNWEQSPDNMTPVHCKPLTEKRRPLTLHRISLFKLIQISAQDRVAEMGMKEKRFRWTLRCTGRSGWAWGKWKCRKLPEGTKPHGTVTKIMLSIILSKSRLEVHYNFKKENMDFKTHLPMSDFALSRHWAILELVKALERVSGGGERGGGGRERAERRGVEW